MSENESIDDTTAKPYARLLELGLDNSQPGQQGNPEHPDQDTPRPIAVGSEIDGFTILEEVGRGGMGVVYKAAERDLNRIVAMKVLSSGIAKDPEAVKQLRHEAAVAASLQHPNIVKIHQIDKQDPPRFFVMEFVQGVSLRQKVEDEGMCPSAQAVRIMIQVCEALQEAHGKNILHRDIKPSNILLENNLERVKVTDFGIAQEVGARVADKSGDTEAAAGTRSFMSPEQSQSRELDERTDIFSLGMTLYYLLTGELAANSRSQLAPAFLFEEQEFVPPSHLNPEVSRDLDRVVLKMIATRRKHRYRNCTVLLTELRSLAGDGRSSGAHRRRPRGGRYTKLMVLLAALLAIAASLVSLHPTLVGLLSSGRQVPSQAAGGSAPIKPHHLVVIRSMVIVFLQDGRPAWSVGADGLVTTAVLAELYPDKPKFLIFGVREPGEDAGKLFVYDGEGKLAWVRSTVERYPYSGRARNRMGIRALFVADLWQNGYPQIVTMSNDVGGFPGKISVFDRSGALRKTYWNPGNLHGFLAFKPSKGDRLQILAWGCNNDMRRTMPGSDKSVNPRAIVCLDPETMSGEAPPRRGTIGQGTELWYAVVLPADTVVHGVTVRPPWAGAPEGTAGQELDVSLSGSVFVRLDEEGRFLDSTYGDGASGKGGVEIELVR